MRVENTHSTDSKLLFPIVQNRPRSDTVARERPELLQPFHEIGGKSRGGFDLNREEFPLLPDQEIDFVAMGVAEEIDLRPDSAVQGALDDFRNHEVLVETAAQAVGVKIDVTSAENN